MKKEELILNESSFKKLEKIFTVKEKKVYMIWIFKLDWVESCSDFC